MGPTTTRTLGMRLSCNFVNVYTFIMYSTRTRVHARIPNGPPREVKRASDKSGACPARGELNGPRTPRQADCPGARRGRPCRLPRTPDTPTSARGSSDTNAYGTGSVKIWQTRHKISVYMCDVAKS